MGDDQPIHHKLIDDITTLLSYPPPFIFINDPVSPRVTANILKTTISNLPLRISRWVPEWESECSNWHKDDDASDEKTSYNSSFGDFTRGLRDVHHSYAGKGKEKASEDSETRLVIAIDNAERLKDSIPNVFVPFTRLAELSDLEPALTVIFLSRARWEDIRPGMGASPDPFTIDVEPLSKDDIAKFLEGAYLRVCDESPSGAYDQTLLPLYKQFISAVIGISFPFTHDPEELQYVAAAQWPRFADAALQEGLDEMSRLRLLRSFAPSMTAAFEAIYPRHIYAQDLIEDATMLPSASIDPSQDGSEDVWTWLGRAGTEEEEKRRGPKPGAGKAIKIPQRLLGPSTFPLDRLLAILGALVEENEVDDDRIDIGEEMSIPGEWTDMEVGRAGVLATVTELTSMRLLHRTTIAEKLDGPPVFKCGVTFETALEFARELGVPLMDLLWE